MKVDVLIKQIVTFKVQYLGPKWKSLKFSFEKRDFPKVWMKCLEIARLQDFAPNSPVPEPLQGRIQEFQNGGGGAVPAR